MWYTKLETDKSITSNTTTIISPSTYATCFGSTDNPQVLNKNMANSPIQAIIAPENLCVQFIASNYTLWAIFWTSSVEKKLKYRKEKWYRSDIPSTISLLKHIKYYTQKGSNKTKKYKTHNNFFQLKCVLKSKL